MEELKKLKDISWNVDEPAYRADEALSYSTLAKFAREGFNKLDTLFDKVETPSLTFGSAVDALITGGQEEFDNNFLVADFPVVPDSIVTIVRELFKTFKDDFRTLESISDTLVIQTADSFNYQPNWRPETRAKVIKEKGNEYYKLLYNAVDKVIIDNNTYNDVLKAVEALKTSHATKEYFAPNNPFDESVVREYQLKFKATFGTIDYRCMADLLYINRQEKVVYPIDLKTSSHTEWDFYESFLQWRYK